MFVERLLRHETDPPASIASDVFCAFWREIIRERLAVPDLGTYFEMDAVQLVEFRNLLIDPYSAWPRADRIKHSHMVQDVLGIAERKKRVHLPMRIDEFMSLLNSYEKDLE